MTKRTVKRALGFQLDEQAYEALRTSEEHQQHQGEASATSDHLSEHDTGEANASWVGLLLFSWFNSVVSLGRVKPLYLKDLGRLLPELAPSVCADELEANWKKECRDPTTHIPSLFRALFYTYRWRFVMIAVPRLWRINSGFLTPWLLKSIIEVIESPGSHSPWYGFALVLALFFDFQIGNLSFQQYCQMILRAEMSIKSSVTSLLYKKLLRLSAPAKQSNIHGKLMNLIGSDIGRMMEMVWYGHFFWLTPILVVVCFFTVVSMTGIYAALAGFGLLLVFVPISALVAKKLEHLREVQTELTDARVRTTNEIFHTMKTVKLYALEEHFSVGADEARRVEIEAIRRMQLWKAVSESINDSTIPLMCLVTIITFVVRGGILTPAIAFSLITIYAALHWPFLMITSSLSATIEFLVSVKRVEDFLRLPEMPGVPKIEESSEGLESGEIHISDASFAWEFEETLHNINFSTSPGSLTCIIGPVGSGKSSFLNTLLGEIRQTSGSTRLKGVISYAPQTPFLLHATVRENITFGKDFVEERYAQTIECCALQADLDMLVAGDLTVIGERGINLSGGQKARIAMARAVYSDADICLLDDPLSAVDAHVGHKLFNDCIKVMLKSKTVLLVTHQLQYVTHGDQLVVMQGGSILHFGTPQKLRTDGVDVAALLEKFNEDLNKHVPPTDIGNGSLAMDVEEDDELRSSFDDSLHLSASLGNGAVELRRSAHLKRSQTSAGSQTSADGSGSVAGESQAPLSMLDDDLEYKPQLTAEQQAAAFSKVNVTQKEERGQGSIAANVYKFYFSHKLWWWLLAILFIVLHRSIDLGIQVYLGEWSSHNAKSNNDHSNAPGTPPVPEPFLDPAFSPSIPLTPSSPSLVASAAFAAVFTSLYNAAAEVTRAVTSKIAPGTMRFLIVYTVGNFGLLIFQMLKASLILIVCCWTGKVVYMQMFKRLLTAPMSFFDTTPKGRISARCSTDTDAMDNRIGDPLSMVISALAVIIGSMAILFASVRWWVLGIIPILLVYWGIYNRIIGTFRDLTRLEGNAQAPMNTIFSESLNGLFTLRAFGRQDAFLQELYHKLDCINRIFYHKGSCERWLGLRMECLGTILACIPGLIGVFGNSLNPGLVAVALTSLIMNSEMVGDLIHGYTHVESYMNSVDRIQQYTKIESEKPAHNPDYMPPESWPDQGFIKFDNVSFRYRPGLPLVLKDMTFLIKPGEKIGVVGRTGAGKSSILSALLCLAPLAGGKIIIDDFDIEKLGVADLRSRLSIIPQDPVIFEGSVRHNIDPFGKHGDDEIWSILKRIHLGDVIEALPHKLDSELAEDGANFSLGQRQLICVGRALLKRSKILLLDEASSSIDLETDYLLQQTLRTEFAHCTTITIAHRLATIMDSDRVLVLDAGTVKEFDSPTDLLANPNSLFTHLHQQTQSSAQSASAEVSSNLDVEPLIM